MSGLLGGARSAPLQTYGTTRRTYGSRPQGVAAPGSRYRRRAPHRARWRRPQAQEAMIPALRLAAGGGCPTRRIWAYSHSVTIPGSAGLFHPPKTPSGGSVAPCSLFYSPPRWPLCPASDASGRANTAPRVDRQPPGGPWKVSGPLPSCAEPAPAVERECPARCPPPCRRWRAFPERRRTVSRDKTAIEECFL